MKRFFGALAAAAVMAAPITVQAQAPVDPTVSVVITDNIFPTGGTGYAQNGGGYSANFTVNFPAPVGDRTFTDYLIWCIDAGRGVTLNQPTNFALYTLADFAATNLGSANGHNPDLADMTRLASLQAALAAGWNNPGINQADYQGSIWSEFDGYANYGNDANLGSIIAGDPYFNVSEYYVLWNGTNQTFLTKISEPSSALLAFAGMGAFLVAVRRRRAS
ncbi:hypothetical protein [Gemmatimonas sp. UBA7669]|uniref:hypothetical protein n=1 Tax=Gemmatimonas sp. UBA7669 TaxID=1946568 RepID=UPI0025C5133E|nr:hypothetical protein [Gemmatimonas sp. UBA7669]